MRRSVSELHDIAWEMIELIGEEEFINDILQALNVDELEDNLKHIDTCRDLGFFE